jgi:arsenate reductase
MFPGPAKRIHWSFDDPAEASGSDDQIAAFFRRVRDQITQKIRTFAVENAD